jgi:lysozyme
MATMPARGGTAAAWIAIAAVFVAGYEGFAARPYVDTIGTGRPTTWCYGRTSADSPEPPMTMVFTKDACLSALGEDLDKYDKMVHKCIKVPLPPNREAALVSFEYNVGQRALCHSSVARYINAGNIRAGCRAMLQFNHAAGKTLAGLTRRRHAEMKLCLRDD